MTTVRKPRRLALGGLPGLVTCRWGTAAGAAGLRAARGSAAQERSQYPRGPQAGNRRTVRIALTAPGRDLVAEVTRRRREELARVAKSGGPAGGGGRVRARAGSPTSAANCPNPAGVCKVRNRAVAEVTT